MLKNSCSAGALAGGEAWLQLATRIASVEIDRKWDFEGKLLAKPNDVKHN
jgi:hypothetical protein